MKNFKKIASAIAALSLAACVAVPMSATVFTASAKTTVTFKNEVGTGHTYDVYKVFDGEATTNGMNTSAGATLTNVKWSDETNGGKLLTALQKDITFGEESSNLFKDCTSAQAVANVLGDNTFTSDMAKKFAALVVETFSPVESGVASNALTIDKDGYYVLADAGSSEQGSAKSLYLLGVIDGDSTETTTVDVTVKASAPTVDKQVSDDDNETDATSEEATNSTNKDQDTTWNESADHAINEPFKFKLKATLAADDDYKHYETYKLVFTDTMSAGVAFDSLESITVDNQTIDLSSLSGSGISCTASSTTNNGGTAPTDWTLTINDLKNIEGVDLSNGAVIEVVYNAHLTENAAANKKSGSTSNENSVKLEYSNNPNASGSGDWEGNHGETPDDNVWIFTYEVDNQKIAGDHKDDEEDTLKYLNDAEFALYPCNKATYSAGSAVPGAIKFSDTKGVYVPNESGDEKVISNGENGTFNFKGLDAGTYTLVETKAPAGYNTVDPIEIVITGTHKELDTLTSNNVDLTITQNGNKLAGDGTENPYIEIVDNKGATLPSTGGIGTTLFYLGGGALVAVAGVMLITKKRMTKE